MRFCGFTDQWNSINFNNLFTYIPNNTLSRAELNYDAGEYKNVHYGDVLIKFGPVLDAAVDELPFITDASTKKLGNSMLMDGDVIIADTAEDEAVGKATEIINVGDQQIVSGLHTIACRPTIKMSPTYLGFYLNTEAYHKQLYALMQGVKVLSISKSNIEDTVIRYPSSQEQKRICDLLNSLEARITKQGKLIERLKKYKRGAINAFFNQNDGSTHKCVLGEIGKIIRGLSYDKFDVVNDDSATVVLRSNNIQGGFLNYRDDLQYVKKAPAKEQVLQKGDIVICMANGSASLVGKAACFDGYDSRVLTVGAFCGIYRCENEIIEYYFQSDKYTYALRKMQQGGDGAIGNLKPSSIESLEVWLPAEEQKKAAFEFFKSLDLKIYATEKILSLLMKMKTGLLNSLFI